MQIELKDATRKFSRVTALDAFSACFASGELVAVLGLNGAGKSTLLRALSGAIGLTSGELLYEGRPFSCDNLEMRRSVLFVPDSSPLIDGETVLRNISIFLTQYQRTEESAMGDKVIALLEQFDLVEKADTPVEDLSRGQAYKVALIILAAINPAAWILDEPFASGMDANGIRLFRKLAREAAASGRIVIYTTQLVDLAENFANRVCVINRGRCYASVDSRELRTLAETDHLIAKLIGEG